MEEIKKRPGENFFWFMQIATTVFVIGLVFFDLFFLFSYLENGIHKILFPFLNILLLVILTVNIFALARFFSKLKKSQEYFGAEAEKRAEKIKDFDKITRQLVRRELELARTNKRLAEIDETKSDFVSVAAHQLRTPLTGIKWSYMALIDEETGPINEEQKKILQNGLTTINYTIELVTDLLNVAHIEQGKYGFAFGKHSIVAIVKKALARFNPMIKEKKITIESKMDESDPLEIDVDGEKMVIAIANIIDNAVKYTPNEGTIELSVAKERGQIKITIHDSGIGIPKSEIGRLFTKFFRAPNAVKYQTSGTGLGLYLTKNIIESHGGKILVSSEEGKGTTFIITLSEKSERRK